MLALFSGPAHAGSRPFALAFSFAAGLPSAVSAQAPQQRMEDIVVTSTRTPQTRADLLADATVISGNAKDASGDLGALRSEVDASLRKVDRLISELNRKWPFAPKPQEVKLP